MQTLIGLAVITFAFFAVPALLGALSGMYMNKYHPKPTPQFILDERAAFAAKVAKAKEPYAPTIADFH